jgi:hypothetical protein
MKQITVITPPDRPGTLADIAERLAARGVNILDIDATDDHAHGVILLSAEPYDEALRALTDAGYHAVSEDALVVRLKDEPGGLARVAARFREPRINITTMRFLRRDGGWATVVLSTDDNARARELLADCLV